MNFGLFINDCDTLSYLLVSGVQVVGTFRNGKYTCHFDALGEDGVCGVRLNRVTCVYIIYLVITVNLSYLVSLSSSKRNEN